MILIDIIIYYMYVRVCSCMCNTTFTRQMSAADGLLWDGRQMPGFAFPLLPQQAHAMGAETWLRQVAA